MIWKYVWKQLRRYRFVTMLLVLQLVLMYAASIAMTSGILSRYADYLPFREYLHMAGDYYAVSDIRDPQTSIGWDRQQLAAHLKGNPKVIATHTPNLALKRIGRPQYEVPDGEELSEYLKNWDDSEVRCYAYDDEWLWAYTPELESGTWFSPEETLIDGCVPVVISQNDRGYKTGDRIPLSLYGDACYGEAIVKGVLEEGARIIEMRYPKHREFGVEHFYNNNYYEVEEDILFLMPYRSFRAATGEIAVASNQMLVLYPNGVSMADRQWNDAYIRQCTFSLRRACTMKSVRKDSIAYIYSEVKKLVPIVISILILVITSVVSMTAMITKRQLHTYAVYHICGLTWRSCILFNLLSSLIISLAGVMCTLLLWACCKPLLADTVIRMSLWHIPVCLGVTVIFLSAGMLLPFSILRTHTAKEILREN